MSEKLKPCPFCGSPAVMIERKSGAGHYAIGCTRESCIIFLPPNAKKNELHNYAWCYSHKENAIAAWNTRAEVKE